MATVASAPKTDTDTKTKVKPLKSEDIIAAAAKAKTLGELAHAVGRKVGDEDFQRRVGHLQQGSRELAGTQEKFPITYKEPRPQTRKAAADASSAKVAAAKGKQTAKAGK